MLAACHSLPAYAPNLLVVEDDPNLRRTISTVLAACGYRVRSSHDGFSALKDIRAQLPDIVLSDLFMQGMSGFELLAVIRRRFPTIRVVAMSGSYSGRDVPAGVAADAFYEKATNIRSLLAIIGNIQKAVPMAMRHESAAPIWIAAPTEDPDGGACVLLSCTECLRAFSEKTGAYFETIRDAFCPFCDMPIQYALVDPRMETRIETRLSAVDGTTFERPRRWDGPPAKL